MNNFELLQTISTDIFPNEIFVANENFTIDITSDAKIKISYLGENFTKNFLLGEGKIEKINPTNKNKHTVCSVCLKNLVALTDQEIIAELGGEERVEMTLSEVFCILKENESFLLKVKNFSNIFYVRDKNLNLRSVSIRFMDGGWNVGSPSFRNDRWATGNNFFVPNN